ncbi:hypothetical protein HDA32_004598 [Spinactinospora alkalitolerans]|uniref:Uncharacterized protein n=1 Tax=Spinactinospora alkalitolerans TaxID=687207 RepID=A0A852TZX3_9ACTN|nr:hypothetical protein [Spinactinospora alkalitolerans]NYE49478.1 hypothetical protein [Spinactinospora alkalitolerans]
MSGCCTPNDHDPTPGEERTGKIALVLILAISIATLATVGILVLG